MFNRFAFCPIFDTAGTGGNCGRSFVKAPPLSGLKAGRGAKFGRLLIRAQQMPHEFSSALWHQHQQITHGIFTQFRRHPRQAEFAAAALPIPTDHGPGLASVRPRNFHRSAVIFPLHRSRCRKKAPRRFRQIQTGLVALTHPRIGWRDHLAQRLSGLQRIPHRRPGGGFAMIYLVSPSHMTSQNIGKTGGKRMDDNDWMGLGSLNELNPSPVWKHLF